MKKIVIVADSTADILKLALRLENNFEIIWLTYHREVYLKLKKLNFKKIYLCNLTKKIETNFFFKKIVQKVFDKISNVLKLRRTQIITGLQRTRRKRLNHKLLRYNNRCLNKKRK